MEDKVEQKGKKGIFQGWKIVKKRNSNKLPKMKIIIISFNMKHCE